MRPLAGFPDGLVDQFQRVPADHGQAAGAVHFEFAVGTGYPHGQFAAPHIVNAEVFVEQANEGANRG